MSRPAFDTSAAVPFLVRSHDAHSAVRGHVAGRQPVLTTQSLAETYSVLARLPGDALVGLASRAAGVPLLTRDARAESTYRVLGVATETTGQ